MTTALSSDPRWTAEQVAICDFIAAGSSCKVVAYAGTGKTSTIALAAGAHPSPSVYFAFNVAAAQDAGRRFGALLHVGVSTAHAYAMRRVGYRYKHRLSGSPWQLRAALRERFGVRINAATRGFGDADRIVFSVMDVLRAFEQSADRAIVDRHLPPELVDVRSLSVYAAFVLDLAREAWLDLSDPRGNLPIGHDTYFKVWQLGRPRIDADVVYFDEAQDANPVMLDVVLQQESAQIVLVGDHHQALYGFRGAIDGLERAMLFELPLTASFRFGPAIAAVANLVLECLGARWPLVGAGPSGSVSLEGTVAPTAVLARSNAGLVDAALEQLGAGRRVGIIGGAEAVASMIEGAYALWASGRSSHPSFRLFASWAELVEASETVHGGNYRPFVGLVARYAHGIPDLARRLRTETVSPDACDVVLSTVHKFKGRQSPAVRLAGDFPLFVDDQPGDPAAPAVLVREEAHVAYVGLTRAQAELQLGPFVSVFQASLDRLSSDDGSDLASLAVAPVVGRASLR